MDGRFVQCCIEGDIQAVDVNSRILCRKYSSPPESLDGRFVQKGLAAIVCSINIDALLPEEVSANQCSSEA